MLNEFEVCRKDLEVDMQKKLEELEAQICERERHLKRRGRERITISIT